MIRVILLGRTGNNLFQYAVGRVLAEKHGVGLVLDGSWFNDDGWKEVSHFLKLPMSAKVVRRCSIGTRALRKLTGKHYWEYLGVPIIRERINEFSFEPDILNAPADCLLFGYFQSHKYYESIADELRAELTPLIEHGAQINHSHREVKSLAEDLTSPSSVAVHVRRGDFLNHPTFMVCDHDYYTQAIDLLRSRLNHPRFYIFSDDPVWCRNNFKEPDIQIIDNGTASQNSLHDLHLMSLASHHIIANSTYSWWAAWFGKKEGQSVVMPYRWFTTDVHAPMEDKNAWGENGIILPPISSKA